jgi:uncharacterized membrane protein YoaK (UPF0700 family)
MSETKAPIAVRKPLVGSMLAISLATAAGCVDATGYLLLGGVLVAHMSGNTASSALELEQRLWSQALRHISPLPGFLAGAALGNLGARWLSKRRAPRALVLGLGLELVLLGLALLLIHLLPHAHVWCAALLATTMGLQNATLRRVAKHDVRTTFITGMLIAFVDESIDYFSDERSSARPGLHAGLWCGFFLGAFGGALATARFGQSAILVAMMFVLGAILLALASEAPPEDAAPSQA